MWSFFGAGEVNTVRRRCSLTMPSHLTVPPQIIHLVALHASGDVAAHFAYYELSVALLEEEKEIEKSANEYLYVLIGVCLCALCDECIWRHSWRRRNWISRQADVFITFLISCFVVVRWFIFRRLRQEEALYA